MKTSQIHIHRIWWPKLTVTAFQCLTTETASLDIDLSIKLDLLWVANSLRCHSHQAKQGGNSHSLANIGTRFMDLCLAASSKVSESRWIDVGAQFVLQATLHEQSEGTTISNDLDQLRSWTSDNAARNAQWEHTWLSELSRYAVLPKDAQVSPEQKYPFTLFKAMVMEFLLDLMTTLDPPILIQLECGKLGNLSRTETQKLLERAGQR